MHKKVLQVLVLITSLAIVGAPCLSMDDSETNRTDSGRIRVNPEQSHPNNPFLTGMQVQPSHNPFRSNAAHQEQGLSNSSLTTRQPTYNPWNQSQNQYPPAPIVQQHIPNPWNQSQNQYASASTTQQPAYNQWSQTQNPYPPTPIVQQHTPNPWYESQNQYASASTTQQPVYNPWHQTQNQSSAPTTQQSTSSPFITNTAYQGQRSLNSFFPTAADEEQLSTNLFRTNSTQQEQRLTSPFMTNSTYQEQPSTNPFIIQAQQEELVLLDLENAILEDMVQSCESFMLKNSILEQMLQNNKITFDLIQRLAKIGNRRAQYIIGFYYKSNNINEQKEWLQKAADQGHAGAQYILGYSYLRGSGVPQNKPEGLKWLHKAADQEHANAQNYLGYCYLNGHDGIAQSIPEGLKWLHKAADQGHANAQENLGLRYMFGTDVARNTSEGLRWLQKAADQGHAVASSLLENNASSLLRRTDPQKQPVQAHSEEHHDAPSKAKDDERAYVQPGKYEKAFIAEVTEWNPKRRCQVKDTTTPKIVKLGTEQVSAGYSESRNPNYTPQWQGDARGTTTTYHYKTVDKMGKDPNYKPSLKCSNCSRSYDKTPVDMQIYLSHENQTDYLTIYKHITWHEAAKPTEFAIPCSKHKQTAPYWSPAPLDKPWDWISVLTQAWHAAVRLDQGNIELSQNRIVLWYAGPPKTSTPKVEESTCLVQ